jgi:hypothetical protein
METIIAAALEGAVEIASLIKKALDASREGDELAALKLLDEALTKTKAAVDLVKPALDEVRARVLKAIDEQFDPAFLGQVVPAAIPLTLGPGEKKIQDLAIR